MAKNIQQQGGVIPHVRPGKPTADFLARTNNRLTLFAALFLAVLATLPNLFTVGLQTSVPFAASSLLIAVSVCWRPSASWMICWSAATTTRLPDRKIGAAVRGAAKDILYGWRDFGRCPGLS